MLSIRPHSVRAVVVGLVAFSCLAIASPAFTKPRGHSPRERVEQEDQKAAAERPGPRGEPAKTPSQEATATQPGRLLRAVPFSAPRQAQPERQEARPPGWAQMWSRPAPESGAGPGQVSQRPNPYQWYRGPDKRAVMEVPERAARSQPASPLFRPPRERAEATPSPRGDPGRIEQREAVREPSGGLLDKTPQARPGEDRRLQVPRGEFRGPAADREVRVVPRDQQQAARNRLQERVRERNRLGFRSERPTRDAVGNAVSADVTLIVRDNVSRLSIGYGRIRRDFGPPAHHFVFAPRSRADYWDGYWDGYTDGYSAGRHRRHHPPVVISFYYGYYWSDPYWFAFWYPGYHPAIYHYWGWCPGWVHPTRVYYVPAEYVYVPVTAYRYYPSAYSVDQVGAQRAIEDIRRAWFESEVGPLAYHLTDQLDVRVYFDGEYAYTTTTEDYYAMTVDAMATTQTVAMDFDNPIWVSSHEVFYTGRHVFYDPSGDKQVVYVSYRLRRLGSEWYLVAVGSSLEPIHHQYRDFRYS